MTLVSDSSEVGGSAQCTTDWYCVRSQPRRDHIAAANLRRYRNLEVFTPRLRFRRRTKRGLVWVTEAMFPNYVFARFDRQSISAEVQHTYGVAGIVRFGLFWPTIPAEVIEDLRAVLGSDETCLVEQTVVMGSEVQINGGAFDGFRAVVTRIMPARQRVAVLLDFLGKQTVVELDSEAVTTETDWSQVRSNSVVAARLAVR